MCLLLATHDFHSILLAVEWDTILFFASLFVLVKTLAELGAVISGYYFTNSRTSTTA